MNGLNYNEWIGIGWTGWKKDELEEWIGISWMNKVLYDE